MPEISRFFGIVISLYYDDHLPPHFHARSSGDEAVIAIATQDVLRGWLPFRALELVCEWAMMHEQELMANWERARARRRLMKIEPLS